MKTLSVVFSAWTSLKETTPFVSTLFSTTLNGDYIRSDSPAEVTLPKGLSFFKHQMEGVVYHGIVCDSSKPHFVSDFPEVDGAEGANGKPQPTIDTIVHCAHGFGASSLSFANLVQAAKLRHNKAPGTIAPSAWVAHDTLGFGFTTAGFDLSTHGDHPEEVQKKLFLDANRDPTLSICRTLKAGANKAVFIGHSMGSISAICSAVAWLEEGHAVGGVVLVAPAISVETIDSADLNNFLAAACPLLQSVTSLIRVWHVLPSPLRRLLLAAVLKVGVSLDLFWYIGLRFALGWHQEVDPETMEQYKCPMGRVDWAPWLVAFIESNLIPAPDGSPNPTGPAKAVSRTLREILERLLEAKVKILIVHDPSDTFIPLKNSEELVAQFNDQIALEVVHQYSGHILHEMDPDCVLDAMARHGIVV